VSAVAALTGVLWHHAVVTDRGRTGISGRRSGLPTRLTPIAIALVTAIVAALAGCASKQSLPSPVGDPDPGHRRMAEIAPVLSVLPPGVQPIRRDKYEPVWDSCDAMPGTFGWDPVTVEVDWRYTGHDAHVLAHVSAVMKSLGWTPDHRTAADLSWHRELSTGGYATADLLGGASSRPPSWVMEALATAANHPIGGCV